LTSPPEPFSVARTVAGVHNILGRADGSSRFVVCTGGINLPLYRFLPEFRYHWSSMISQSCSAGTGSVSVLRRSPHRHRRGQERGPPVHIQDCIPYLLLLVRQLFLTASAIFKQICVVQITGSYEPGSQNSTPSQEYSF
jgi:hypothetical protein